MSAASPRHSVSVAAAIVNTRGQVLAVRRRDNGQWEPPGGVLELDEGVEEGLIREVHEETGITVRTPRLTGLYKNMPRRIVALVFRCDLWKGTAIPTAEAQEVRWLDVSEISTLMSEAYAIRILDALSDGPPAIRTHDGRVLLHDRT